MSRKERQELIERYLNGECSDAEKATVEAWYDDFVNRQRRQAAAAPHPAEAQRAVWTSLQREIGQRAIRPHRRRMALSAAAALLLACGIGYYFMNRGANGQNDVPPGYNRATLTLADGRKVALDSAQTGIVVRDGGITYQNGQSLPGVMLPAPSEAPGSENEASHKAGDALLQLSTPKGGQYQIILSDGTRVWLNAQSTLKYPARFSGDKREVEIEGEAYFAVNHDGRAVAPFVVKSRGQEVRVLGTEFNVSAYSDDTGIRTTLVNGAVLVSAQAGDRGMKLLPGEQAIYLGSGGLRKQPTDVERALAWKNGYFKLDGDLQSIMEQVGRWYDIEVVYAEGIDKSRKLRGEISRNKKLSEILGIITEADPSIRFNLDTGSGKPGERRVMVTD